MLKKLLCGLLLLFSMLYGSYLTFNDLGTMYLSVSEDEQKIYLWDINGSLHTTLFPYILPDKTEILIDPYFQDIDQDGNFEIVLVYRTLELLPKKTYKMVIRENGANYDSKIYPQEIKDISEVTVVTINALPDENLVSVDGRAVYNSKYKYYLGKFRHSLYDLTPPTLLALQDIYSKVPTATVELNSPDSDFDRYQVFYRKNDAERFKLFAQILTQNYQLVVSINYPEGIYPWRFFSVDRFDNYTDQQILYYYDHTPPTYLDPSANLNIYFSPNNDGVKDAATIETIPSDNLYYKQTVLLDLFDGPTYVATAKKEAKTFDKVSLSWNGRDAEGKLLPDKKYAVNFYMVDGCGNQSRIVSGAITLDTMQPRISDIYTSGSYFTPNNDGVQDRFECTLNLSEVAAAELKLFNLYNREVKTIKSEPAESFKFVWDGIDADGIIENGNYKYQFVLADLAGNTYRSDFYEVYLDYKSPLILEVGTEKPAFNFKRENFRFTFEVQETVYAALYVLDTNGEKVATVNAGTWFPTGNSVIVWDGRALPEGIFNYRLVVTNSFGNKGAISGVFYSDGRAPYLQYNGFSAEYLPGRITVNYGLSEQATVNIKFIDKNFNLIEQVVNTFQKGGLHSFCLSSVTPDIYYLVAAVVDPAGNDFAVTRSFAVVNVLGGSQGVDQRAPTLTVTNVNPEIFTPNDDGLYETTMVAYRLEDDLDHELSVTLDILNDDGAIVLQKSFQQKPGNYAFVWNGRDSQGVLQRGGVYNLRFDVIDRSGRRAESQEAQVGLSTVALYVKTLNKPAPPYSPASPVTISYAVNFGESAFAKKGFSMSALTPKKAGSLTVQVINSHNILTKTITENALLPAGSYTWQWCPDPLLPDGKYYFYATARNAAGSLTDVYAKEEVIVDKLAPTITAFRVINEKKGGFVTSSKIDLEITATDNLLPVTQIQFSKDGLSWNAPEAFAKFKYGYPLAPTDGIHTIYTKVKDAAGNWSAAASASIIVDQTPPQHQTILVDGVAGGGATTVNVQLKFIAFDLRGISRFKLSYNDAYSWVEYPYGTTINFKLDPVAGLKYFYIKYTDSLGNETAILKDIVSMDRVPPYDLQAVNHSRYWINTRNVEFAVSAKDDFMGVDKIGISNDALQTINWFPYHPSQNYFWQVSAGDGMKSVNIVALDRANNQSNRITLNYVLDTTPPTIVTQDIRTTVGYLPTLKPVISFKITANEETVISFNVRRAGELLCSGSVSNNFGWSGQKNNGQYLRAGSICRIDYQVVDLAGNIGMGGSVTVTLNMGYQLISKNYDLTLPAIEAKNNILRIEYEDDPGYSVKVYDDSRQSYGDNEYMGISNYLVKWRQSYKVVAGRGTANKGMSQVQVYYYFVSGTNYYIDNWSQGYESSSTWEHYFYPVLPKNVKLNVYGRIRSKNDDQTEIWVNIYKKKFSRLEYVNDKFNIVSSDMNDKSVECYNRLTLDDPGTVGNISNNYFVAADSSSGNIYLSRNGTTINITNYPLGSTIQVTEPALYISKRHTAQTGSNYNAEEDIHLVWQQRSSPTGKWEIYYQVVPFSYESLPAASYSMMGVLKPRAAAPQIKFISPLNGDYVNTKPELEISISDDNGVVTGDNKMYLRINNSTATYNVSAFFQRKDNYAGTLNFTLGQDVGPELTDGKNAIALTLVDAAGDIAVGTLEVYVRAGLYIEKILNYPNPFEEDTTITYMLTEEAREVKARIYTITGRLVKELRDLPTKSGYNEYLWDGRDRSDNEVGNDLYYLVILARNGDGEWVKGRTKMVKLR